MEKPLEAMNYALQNKLEPPEVIDDSVLTMVQTRLLRTILQV
jgi:hypothetical protein